MFADAFYKLNNGMVYTGNHFHAIADPLSEEVKLDTSKTLTSTTATAPTVESIDAAIKRKDVFSKEFKKKTMKEHHDRTVVGNVKEQAFNTLDGYNKLLHVDSNYNVHDIMKGAYIRNKYGEKVLDPLVMFDNLDAIVGDLNHDVKAGVIDESEYKSFMGGLNFFANQALRTVDKKYVNASLDNALFQRSMPKNTPEEVATALVKTIKTDNALQNANGNKVKFSKSHDDEFKSLFGVKTDDSMDLSEPHKMSFKELFEESGDKEKSLKGARVNLGGLILEGFDKVTDTSLPKEVKKEIKKGEFKKAKKALVKSGLGTKKNYKGLMITLDKAHQDHENLKAAVEQGIPYSPNEPMLNSGETVQDVRHVPPMATSYVGNKQVVVREQPSKGNGNNILDPDGGTVTAYDAPEASAYVGNKQTATIETPTKGTGDYIQAPARETIVAHEAPNASAFVGNDQVVTQESPSKGTGDYVQATGREQYTYREPEKAQAFVDNKQHMTQEVPTAGPKEVAKFDYYDDQLVPKNKALKKEYDKTIKMVESKIKVKLTPKQKKILSFMLHGVNKEHFNTSLFVKLMNEGKYEEAANNIISLNVDSKGVFDPHRVNEFRQYIEDFKKEINKMKKSTKQPESQMVQF